MARNIVKCGETLLSKMQKKISVLESENKELREELALTQDAVNEMLFMMVNLKGE